jgi:hypothetical protein
VKALCRPREIALFGDRDEGAKMSEVHPAILACLLRYLAGVARGPVRQAMPFRFRRKPNRYRP